MLSRTSHGWVGLDVGARMVKAAQLKRGRNGFEVVAAAIPRSSDPLEPALSQRMSELRALRALAPTLKGADGAAVVSMRDCTLAASTQPDESEPADDNSAIASDEWGADPHGYRLATKLSEVEAVCDGFDRSGMRCNTVDGMPTALARALQLVPQPAAGEPVVGFDWGAASATFVVAQGGEARYARQLRLRGFEEVLADIAQTLSLTPQEAERAVLRHGFAAEHPAGEVVAQALRSATSGLTQELKRTTSHLGGKLKTKTPSRWILFGVAGAIPGFGDVLSAGLDVRTEPWRPEGVTPAEGINAPLCLFGPAIALSALKWEEPQ